MAARHCTGGVKMESYEIGIKCTASLNNVSSTVCSPEAPLEDQARIADEYHAIPPIIPAQD